jgi:hypothetical protein
VNALGARADFLAPHVDVVAASARQTNTGQQSNTSQPQADKTPRATHLLVQFLSS